MSNRDRSHDSARQMALGGVMAALALVIMCLGGLIPLSTYICPMLTMVILQIVIKLCSRRIGWVWYGAVAVLAALMGPDKEAAALFVCRGYYPLLKPRMDKLPLSWLWKGLFFNGVILLMYTALIHLMGMDALAAEFEELGKWLLLALLVAGNFIFFTWDRVLNKLVRS